MVPCDCVGHFGGVKEAATVQLRFTHRIAHVDGPFLMASEPSVIALAVHLKPAAQRLVTGEAESFLSSGHA